MGDFRECIVQLGILDRNKCRVVSWATGSVISARGHILTAAHVIRDVLSGTDTTVLVGVFDGTGRPTRWTYSCRIASDEPALKLKAADQSLVDLAVLQIKAKIDKAQPPVFDGSLTSLEIVNETEIVPSDLSMPYLSTSKAKLEDDHNVRLFGYPQQTGNIRLTQENATASVQDAGWVKVNATKVATSGYSGGPLLNDKGKIVAVMSKDFNGKKDHDQALISGTANLSWFRHLSLIKPEHCMPQSEEMPADLAVDARSQMEKVWDVLRKFLPFNFFPEDLGPSLVPAAEMPNPGDGLLNRNRILDSMELADIEISTDKACERALRSRYNDENLVQGNNSDDELDIVCDDNDRKKDYHLEYRGGRPPRAASSNPFLPYNGRVSALGRVITFLDERGRPERWILNLFFHCIAEIWVWLRNDGLCEDELVEFFGPPTMVLDDLLDDPSLF
jgi:hypothetical protein